MYTLKVKLKQHTPLIHFQHDQEGATLRVSEVKPKLDRFILSKMTEIQLQEGKKNGWIRETEKGYSLCYKLRITVNDEKKPTEYMLASYMKEDNVNKLKDNGINVVSETPYFAQEKENGILCKASPRDIQQCWNQWDYKKGIIYEKLIDMTVLSSSIDLINAIQDNIQAFFLCNNFGTRQSKGFGGFTVESIVNEDKSIPLMNDEQLLCDNFAFVYRKQIPANAESPFPLINQDYQLLKSGRRKPYSKSLLMKYEVGNDIRWEKKYIKSEYNNSPIAADDDNDYLLLTRHKFEGSDRPNVNYKFIRALLGLAEQYEFLLEEPYKNSNKLIVKISNKEIERYQSPLLFKVIGDCIYIVGNEVNPGMLGKSFNFDLSIKNDKGAWSGPIDPLDTPQKFSLRDFILFAMDQPEMKGNYKPIKQ